MSEIIHEISIVIPVYQGETTLEPLIKEIELLTHFQRTPDGHNFRVTEVILVHDGAVDNSDIVMESIAARHPFVSLIWLSRNYGQHSATLAGMASTSSEWVVTMDEDGQHNPNDIGKMLDKAIESGAQLIYAKPINAPPHGRLRNKLSDLAKWIFVNLLGNQQIGRFHSFRFLRGEIARSLAAYCGVGVFLDVALSWVVACSGSCPVMLRKESSRRSGYNFLKLTAHFLRLVLSSGTKPLRFISFLGLFSILLGLFISLYALWGRLTARVPVQGWTSLIIVVCLFSGLILFSLGIIAEYIGLISNITMGRPLYLTVSRPNRNKVRRI